MTHKFNVPYVSGKELEYIRQVFDNKFFAGNGPFSKRAQKFLEDRYGVPHVLLTHSCTGGLELAALLFDLGPDDEVIIPSYTFCSTGSAFRRTGARIVFCEVDPATMNLDADDVAKRVTSRTKVIVPVHYGGIAADMDPLQKLARKHNLHLVEDAAQGIEAKLRDKWLGTLSPLGVLSFHETKNIHCGLGGAVFVNDDRLFDRAEDIWERGTNRTKLFKGLVDKYSWVELGSSFYPSEFQAAFLLAQLEALDANLAGRKAIYDAYKAGLAPLAERGALALPRIDADRTVNYHSFFIILNSIDDCDGLRVHLKEQDIQAYIGYVPLHSSPMGLGLGYKPEDLPITEEYAQRVLRLPMHHELSAKDASGIAAAIAAYFGS